MPTTASDSNRGDDATSTTALSREHLKTLSGDDLRVLCRDRGLEANGRPGVLVNRLLKDQKKAPKSNAARVAAHRANRSDAKIEQDNASNAVFLLTELKPSFFEDADVEPGEEVWVCPLPERRRHRRMRVQAG